MECLQGEEAHRATLSGARRLGQGAVWRCLIAWGGTLGGGQRLEARFDSEVLSLAGADGAGTRVKLSDRWLGDGQLSVALRHTRWQPAMPWHGGVEWRGSAAVECEEQSDGTPCAWQLEEKENFASALQRIEVRVNAGRHKSVSAGREPGAVETGAEVAVYSLAGTRAEWRGRLLSLARRARERQVAGG
jgi:hypothetical protein